MKKIILSFLLLGLFSCSENEHQQPTHNFTVKRIIILNDQNEMLMGKEESNWYTPSIVYNKSQFIRESMDSLANAYGITITRPKLHGYFSYKYEYHPFSTLWAYYVARYKGGEIKVSGNLEEVQWVPVQEALERLQVKSMREITKQILNYPNKVWGGSFSVYLDGEEHQTRVIEDFYPIFE